MGDPANHAISDDLEEVVGLYLPRGSTILELGSGVGTGRLARRYHMISIEHDRAWLWREESKYIYAPIEPFRKPCAVFPTDAGWYSREVLRRELPKIRYDLILVDGPPNSIGRGGFFKWRELFDLSKTIVIDDVHRERERKVADLLSRELRRPYSVYSWTKRHHFAVIPAE